MSKARMMLYLTMLPLSACGTIGPENNSFCQLASPIYLSTQDSVKGETAREILIYDDKGAELCGWVKT